MREGFLEEGMVTGVYSACSVARPMVARLLNRVSEEGNSSSLDRETGTCKVNQPRLPKLGSPPHPLAHLILFPRPTASQKRLTHLCLPPWGWQASLSISAVLVMGPRALHMLGKYLQALAQAERDL